MDAPPRGASGGGAGTLRHFYCRVATAEAKLNTLLALIGALRAATTPLAVVVVCSARDSLDAVLAALLGAEGIEASCLHSDLSERELEAVAQRFKRPWRAESPEAGDGAVPDAGDAAPEAAEAAATAACRVLAATDAALRTLPREALPLAPTLMVSFNGAAGRDALARRVAAALGSRAAAAAAGAPRRLAVALVEAGRGGEELRALVDAAGERPVEELPVRVGDLFADNTPA